MLLFIHNLLATDTETLVDDHWRSGSNMWGARDAGLTSRCNFFNFHAVLPKILPNTIAFRPKLWGPPPPPQRILVPPLLKAGIQRLFQELVMEVD